MSARGLLFFAIGSICWAAGCTGSQSDISDNDKHLRIDATRQLRDSLGTQQRWVKVHAAEFLVSLDYRDGVREEFAEELRLHGEEPEYRIGIWRVLAQLDQHDRAVFREHLQTIEAALLDETGVDRIHAVESLAKLGVAYPEADPVRIELERFAKSGPISGQAYAWWALLNSGATEAESRLIELLSHDESICEANSGLCVSPSGNNLPRSQISTRTCLAE